MPAKLVTGEDARDVAAYVASAAAKPGKDTGALGARRRRQGQGHRQGEERHARHPGRPVGRLAYKFADATATAGQVDDRVQEHAARSTTTSRSRATASTRTARSSRTAAPRRFSVDLKPGELHVLLLGPRPPRGRHGGQAHRQVSGACGAPPRALRRRVGCSSCAARQKKQQSAKTMITMSSVTIRRAGDLLVGERGQAEPRRRSRRRPCRSARGEHEAHPQEHRRHARGEEVAGSSTGRRACAGAWARAPTTRRASPTPMKHMCWSAWTSGWRTAASNEDREVPAVEARACRPGSRPAAGAATGTRAAASAAGERDERGPRQEEHQHRVAHAGEQQRRRQVGDQQVLGHVGATAGRRRACGAGRGARSPTARSPMCQQHDLASAARATPRPRRMRSARRYSPSARQRGRPTPGSNCTSAMLTPQCSALEERLDQQREHDDHGRDTRST